MQKLRVREAAENLGISEDAVRKRIQRGTLAHHRSSDGHVYVYMDNHAGAQQETSVEGISATKAIVANDNSTARDDQPPSWTPRIILIVVVSGVLAMLAALAWPIIENPSRLGTINLSRFWVAIIVAATSSTTFFLVYRVAKKTLWELLEILIVPLALAIIGFGFTAQQEARQLALQKEGAQNAALQAYLDQMSNLMLEKDLPGSEEGDPAFILAQARTITALSQLNEDSGKVLSNFLTSSGLLRRPALLAKANLENAEFSKVVLPDANLAGTYLKDADLTDAVLVGADFSAEEKVYGVTQPITADLTLADLSNAALQGANLSECRLTYADLTDASLQSADLRGADLRSADLSDAALQDADLSPATVPGHRGLKTPTDLTDTNLADADLTGADLTGADLTGAELSMADLPNAKVTEEQLRKAASLQGATMPNGQLYEDWLKDKKAKGKDEKNE